MQLRLDTVMERLHTLFCVPWVPAIFNNTVVTAVKENQTWTVVKYENSFNSGTVARRGKRPQCRPGLHSKYEKEQWVVVAKEQVSGVGGWGIPKRR